MIDNQDLLFRETFDDTESLWQLYHENTKVNDRFYIGSDEYVVARTESMHASLPYDSYPKIELPQRLTRSNLSFEDTVLNRVTARKMCPCSLTLRDIATLLHYAYGITRDNSKTNYPRDFRTVPSGGALYPLEIYFHTTHTKNLEPGFYHYNPTINAVSRIMDGDHNIAIAEAMVPMLSHLAFDCSLMIFITALFERQTFKYGPRAYRFVFLEAGHVAQNLNLTATNIGLGSINICGYYDRKIDKLLRLDGLSHSTIYMMGIGKQLDK